MGQKTHPVGFRLVVNKNWSSKWFAKKNYADLLNEDLMIRKYVKTRLALTGLSKVEIERAPKRITLTIHTARPGIVIGKKGQEVDLLRDELQRLTKKEIYINIQEVKFPELDSELVAQNIAKQLAARVAFRRVVKRAMFATQKLGAKGIKIVISGRLAGAEMARRERFWEGKVPLHTLRADIDYASVTSHTTYGCIGVKVWIYKGEKVVE